MIETSNGWTTVLLENVVDILDTMRIPLNASERQRRISGKKADQLFPYYGATGQSGFIDDYLFDEPLILLGEDGVPFLDSVRPKAYRISGKTWVNNHAHVLRVHNEIIDERFLTYFLNLHDYTGFVTGSTRLKLTQAAMRRIPIPIAPINEQRRIADKLDILFMHLASYRSRLDRIPYIIEKLRKSILIAAISGQLTNKWRKQHARLPGNWATKFGDDVFSLITSGSRGWASYYSESGACFLRVGNLDRNTINLDLRDVQHVTPPNGAEGERTKIEVGDILISITADVGMIGFVRDDIGEAYINQHLCLARPKPEYLGEYLAYFLASPIGGGPQLSSLEKGATKTGISLKNVRDIKILLPERDEQEEIVRQVKILYKLADQIEARHDAAREQMDKITPTILNKAWRGELVEQDYNDESALSMVDRFFKEKKASTNLDLLKARNKKKMVKPNKESLIASIKNIEKDSFTFEELRTNLTFEYEPLKKLIFDLLNDHPPLLKQEFDEQGKIMKLIKLKP